VLCPTLVGRTKQGESSASKNGFLGTEQEGGQASPLLSRVFGAVLNRPNTVRTWGEGVKARSRR